MKFCYDCANIINDVDVICPYCEANTSLNTRPKEAYQLTPGTGLKNGRYLVGRALGYGGFGVTYAAFDFTLQKRVAIKEYLPSEFATRAPGTLSLTVFGGDENSALYIKGLQSFTDEAQRLAKFNNVPGVVSIYDVFSENNTSYMVMELLDGRTVKQLLEERGRLPFDEALNMIVPVLDTLTTVHSQGIIHRDIAPDNIFITFDNKAKLLDFGAARYATANVSKSLSVLLKPGYSPPEQYRSKGNQGSWTDVYAVAATLYKMLTGITPGDSLDRAARDSLVPPSKLGVDVPKGAETALLNALNTNVDCRTKTAEEFRDQLLKDEVTRIEDARTKKPWSLPKWVYFALAGLLSAGAILGILLLTGVISFIDRGSIDKDASGNTPVPKLIGLTTDQAEAEYPDWNFSIDGAAETNEVPENCIMAQEPAFGTYVPIGTSISITVNKGLEIVAGVMPDVLLFRPEEVLDALDGHNVFPEYRYDSTHNPGIIIDSDPKPGEPLEEGQSVTLVVSVGGLLDGVQIIPDVDVIELELGGEAWEISAAPLPASTDEKEVDYVWEVEDTSVAEYKNGRIVAVSAGETTVRVTASMENALTGETVTVTESKRIIVTKPAEPETPSAEPVTDTPAPTETEAPTDTPTAPPTITPAPTTITPAPTTITPAPPTTTPVKWFTVNFDLNGGSGSISPIQAEIGKTPSSLPNPSRTGFTFDGWYTSASGGTKVTLSNWNSVIGGMNEGSLISDGLTLYAHWTVRSFTASWNNVTGGRINVRRTKSPNAGASTGTISNGAAVYYGDVLEITYSADTGYTVTGSGAASITVTGPVTSSNIWMEISVNAYTINWSNVAHCNISVTRQASPNAGAYTGTLYKGDTIYYGDSIAVTYSPEKGYIVTDHGAENITVNGNVTSSDIWANVTAKLLTYNILYKSSNNYSLGTSKIEGKWGTTITVTPPAIPGYITPAPQTVIFDSETPKTIIFIYVPKAIPSSQTAASGWWWEGNPGTGVSYSVKAKYQNRTANSVQIKLVWTQSIKSAYYGQDQWFNATIGGVSTGDVKIASYNTWYDGSEHYYTGSVTVETGWISVPAEATKTSVSINANYWTSPSNWVNSSWSYTMPIPTY